MCLCPAFRRPQNKSIFTSVVKLPFWLTGPKYKKDEDYLHSLYKYQVDLRLIYNLSVLQP
uniref:Uncharacterized protein n=1 Tax=Rhizophagus irregularis (strain DAOM 181602 / DAOM 197198 / MUCL 43194) TaxID=747089 RepID=U9TL60_RHIID